MLNARNKFFKNLIFAGSILFFCTSYLITVNTIFLLIINDFGHGSS